MARKKNCDVVHIEYDKKYTLAFKFGDEQFILGRQYKSEYGPTPDNKLVAYTVSFYPFEKLDENDMLWFETPEEVERIIKDFFSEFTYAGFEREVYCAPNYLLFNGD